MPPRTKNPSYRRGDSPSRGRRPERSSTPLRRTRQRTEDCDLTPPPEAHPSGIILRSLSASPTIPPAATPPPQPVDEEENMVTSSSSSEEQDGASRPYKFFFTPKQYVEYPKISTRCSPHKAIEVINKLDDVEKEWFRSHPQFKHIFHMHVDKNRKCMGIWMLAVRTVETGNRSQCWFVVNGVPIRYSLREHGLISGLQCHNYPGDYAELGNMRFVKKHFGEKKPDVQQVLEKLNSMGSPTKGRLKMAVLYFLATVIKGQQKEVKGPIDDFLLRVVDDLELCKSFPWGRFTFDHCVHQVYKMVDKFQTGITANHCLPGFVLPLEVLAFECIETLNSSFREPVEPVEDDCPRMCRGKFKKSALKGFSLAELYDALGDSKAIMSSVVHEGEEDADIALVELYVDNPIVDGWNDILARHGRIWWEDFYKADVESRAISSVPVQAPVEPSVEAPVQPSVEAPVQPPVIDFMKAMEEGFQKLDRKIDDVSARLYDMSARLREVEDRVFKTNVGVSGFGEYMSGGDDYVEVRGGNEEAAGAGAGEEVVAEDEVGADLQLVIVEDEFGAEFQLGEELPAGPSEVGAELPAGPSEVAAELPAGPSEVAAELPAGPSEVAAELPREARKRCPSKFCKTPYTRRAKRKKTQD